MFGLWIEVVASLSKTFGKVLCWGGGGTIAVLQQLTVSPETEGAAVVPLPLVSQRFNLDLVPSPPIFVFSSTDLPGVLIQVWTVAHYEGAQLLVPTDG